MFKQLACLQGLLNALKLRTEVDLRYGTKKICDPICENWRYHRLGPEIHFLPEKASTKFKHCLCKI